MPERVEAPRVLGGRYHLLERLGEGGFGAVYSAEDTELQRIVAVKVLDPARDARTPAEAQQLGERFRREAIATAAISHPNVVTVFDIGVDGREIYIVMELLSGRPLSDELERWPTGMAPARVVPMMVDVLRGLGVGHAAEIVHKDLKPENLFLADPERPNERICVIDFGVARILHDQKLTATGKLVGTPRYLAPEYIEDLRVTPALDVYQMGLILVEVLCGIPCIPRRLDLVTCCQRHVEGELMIPAGLREGPIGRVVARATDVEPLARYATAAEFADALAAVDPASIAVADLTGHRPTPRLGVVPLKKTQPMHGGVAKREATEPSTSVPATKPARRGTRTAPTKPLGPAKEVLEQLREFDASRLDERSANALEEPRSEPDPEPEPRRVTGADVTALADSPPPDPLRAQRWAIYGLVALAFLAVVGTAAFVTVGRRQAQVENVAPTDDPPATAVVTADPEPDRADPAAAPDAGGAVDAAAAPAAAPKVEPPTKAVRPSKAREVAPQPAEKPATADGEEMWVLD